MLASDAAHYYENIETRAAVPRSCSTTDVSIAGFDRVRELAGGDDRWVPGHDPEVLRRYPPAGPGLDGIAARLDATSGP